MAKCYECGVEIKDDEVHVWEESQDKYYEFCERCCPECKVVELYHLEDVKGSYPHLVIPTPETPALYFEKFTTEPVLVSEVVDWQAEHGECSFCGKGAVVRLEWVDREDTFICEECDKNGVASQSGYLCDNCGRWETNCPVDSHEWHLRDLRDISRESRKYSGYGLFEGFVCDECFLEWVEENKEKVELGILEQNIRQQYKKCCQFMGLQFGGLSYFDVSNLTNMGRVVEINGQYFQSAAFDKSSNVRLTAMRHVCALVERLKG